MSTINQQRLILARRIATKLVVSGNMTDNAVIGPRTLTVPVDTGSRRLRQLVTNRVRPFTCSRFPLSRTYVASAERCFPPAAARPRHIVRG